MSEAAALNDILNWSTDRPAWQQDALRRLVVNGALTDTDIDELAAICLDHEAASLPLTEDHIVPESLPGEPIRLLAVDNPVGINALASDQTLVFDEVGLTIVYGDNGSGKSGYVRVLKHACRSRDAKVKILRDVNEPTEMPQSAKIRFKRGATEDDFDWSPTAGGHPDLPSVSIFDSKSANTHVEATNNVAYTPFPMQILEQLASACDTIKIRIDDKIASLEAQTPQAIKSPALSPTTPAGAFITSISPKSNKDTLELLAELSPEEQARYKALDGDLSQDSGRAVARLSSLKTRLVEHTAMLSRLGDAASESEFTRVKELRETRNKTAQVAKAASEQLFAASPLPDIGGSLWKSLWEAARQYSNEVAYPETLFPDAKPDQDLCVLCQQPLDQTAVSRRATFEEFVKGTTKADEADAKIAYEGAIEAAKAALPSVKSLRAAVRLVRSEIGDTVLAADIRRAAFVAVRRVNALVGAKTQPTEPKPIPLDALAAKVADIDQRITQLSAGDSSPERLAMVAEHRALKDRLALQGIKADVEAEIERSIKIATLKKAAKTAAKVSVTKKNKDLSDKLVTDVLRGRFAREVEKLKIGTMPIELRKEKDQSAQSYFRVAFVAQPNEPLGDVLSEGEHRCVALAAFLAELVTSREYSGIVFDDPMSSLDHLYRRSVAHRLVEESEHRQVVIFTHDLTFLYEVTEEAGKHDRNIKFQTVRRRDDRPGFVDDDLPLKAKSSGPMANAIRSYLKSIKGSFDQATEHHRTTIAKGVIAEIREAWEQGVADFIRPVLARFDSNVKPNSLYKLLVLTEDDVSAVTAARSRLSEDVHASPETLNPAEIEHKDLVAELDVLETWLRDTKDRQSKAAKP